MPDGAQPFCGVAAAKAATLGEDLLVEVVLRQLVLRRIVGLDRQVVVDDLATLHRRAVEGVGVFDQGLEKGVCLGGGCFEPQGWPQVEDKQADGAGIARLHGTGHEQHEQEEESFRHEGSVAALHTPW
ncbi:MAG: hypothetical protein JRH20_08715 [Deltaproteobacteria bacterium]|nr:hypothetical protein [Deltaproteobacteria bacterium]